MLSDCKNLFWVCDNCKENIVPKDHPDVDILRKEIDCLQREKGILENLVSETKYANELQKTIIQNQKDKLLNLERNWLNNKTYSEVAKGSNYTFRGDKIRNSNSAVLLIKSKNKDSSNTDQILKDITRLVDTTKLKICINNTRKIKDGIAVQCEDKPSLDTLKSCLTAPLAKKYSIDEPKKYNPRLIIMDARLEGLDSSEDIINSIALLNGLDDSRKSEIKVITKLKRFNMIDLVIEVTPALRNIFLQKEYVFVGLKKSQIKDHIRVIKCFKCCGFGHLEINCKADLHCPKCAGSHKLKDCKSDSVQCSNCLHHNKSYKKNLTVDHRATYAWCPMYKNYINKQQQNINYE
nr:unnamed protein product [Callosobruchus analis]